MNFGDSRTFDLVDTGRSIFLVNLMTSEMSIDVKRYEMETIIFGVIFVEAGRFMGDRLGIVEFYLCGVFYRVVDGPLAFDQRLKMVTFAADEMFVNLVFGQFLKGEVG